jgi:hypothetical protein
MAKVLKILNCTSKFVLFYGAFVMISLLLQCLIPFFSKFVELTGYEGFWILFLNQNFTLPMDIITSFWAAISAGYVGVDRGMYMIDGFKNGGDIDAFTPIQLSHLTQVIIESFLVYSLAVALNIFFDSNLSLTPLATSLGTSVLLYVLGNKGIKASQALSAEEDLNNDGVRDSEQFTAEEIEALKAKLKPEA